ncbi:MAG: hypothetical protein ACKPFA_00905, partial [Dolichospermum sp.]
SIPAFSSFRSIPSDYSFSTERRFKTCACTPILIDLLSSFTRHCPLKWQLSFEENIHGTQSSNS